jgi:FemAB-related protein (PEP-CTERM system-associated)
VVKLSLVQLSDSSRDLWNDYVSANRHGYVYHLWEWGDVLQRTYNLRRWCFAVKEDQHIVGVLPVFYVRGLFFADKLVSLPFCEYGGPLLTDYLDRSMAENVLTVLIKNVHELARKLKIDYIEWRHPSKSFPNFFSSIGFRVLRRYVTFRLDLTVGESGIWKNFDGLRRRRARARLKKAIRIGTEVKDVNVDSLKHYYGLYLRTQKRHGSPPHSYAFFKNLYDGFGSKGLVRMLLAVSKGKPIAGITVFCFNGMLYCWNNILDREYASSHPTDFLLWYLIRWGVENNFKVLDLGRTRPEDAGVYYFKSRWGSQKIGLEDYVFLVRNVEIPDPLQRRYVLLSRLWSLLPQPIARKMGPHVTSKIGL